MSSAIAMPEQQTVVGMESEIDAAIRLVKKYGFVFMGTFGGSIVSWRLMNKAKVKNKTTYHFKPHPLMLDIGGWAIVVCVTYWSWIFHGLTVDYALYLCLGIGFFHTTIVKLFFKFAPKKAVDFIQEGIPVDDDGNLALTVIGHLTVGVKQGNRTARRKDDSEWTEEQRDEFTQIIKKVDKDSITDRKYENE
jgi:hypothetical protein